MHNDLKIDLLHSEDNSVLVPDSGDTPSTTPSTSLGSSPDGSTSLYDSIESSSTYSSASTNSSLTDPAEGVGEEGQKNFEYLGWDELSEKFIGDKYRSEIIRSYEAGSVKPKKAKELGLNLDVYKNDKAMYNLLHRAADDFIESNLSVQFKKLIGNDILTVEQKNFVKDIVHSLGVLYQVEVASLTLECCATGHYDTLFYQKDIGPVIAKLVNLYTNGVDIRQRPKEILRSISEETTSPEIDSPDNEEPSYSDFLRAFGSLSTLHTFIQEDLESCLHDTSGQFSSNYNGKKVLATISVACSAASAKDYNTDEGLKLFIEALDPRLQNLTLLRVDTAHIWTELQCKVLDLATTCGDYNEFEGHIESLFVTNADSMPDFKTKLPEVNEESEIWTICYALVKKAGEDWENLYFQKLLNVLKSNHFVSHQSFIDPRYYSTGGATASWLDYKYESRYSKELKIIQKAKDCSPIIDKTLKKYIEEIYQDMRNSSNRSISRPPRGEVDVAVSALGLAESGLFSNANAKPEFYNDLNRLDTLCFVLTLLENEKILSYLTRNTIFKKGDIAAASKKVKKDIEVILTSQRDAPAVLVDLQQTVESLVAGSLDDVTKLKDHRNYSSLIYFYINRCVSSTSTDHELREQEVQSAFRKYQHTVSLASPRGPDDATPVFTTP